MIYGSVNSYKMISKGAANIQVFEDGATDNLCLPVLDFELERSSLISPDDN